MVTIVQTALKLIVKDICQKIEMASSSTFMIFHLKLNFN